MNRRIAAALLVVGAIVAVVVLRGWGDEEEAAAPEPEPAPRYEVYVDVSESAADRLEGPITDAVHELVRDAAGEGAAVTIHPLSDSSSSAPEIANADFGAPPETKREGFLLRNWRNGERRRVERDFAEWAGRATPTDETDLLGALVNASGPAGNSDEHPVTIVLVSDGLNYTTQWNWAEGPLDGPGCRELAEGLTLPDLGGAEVVFRTAGHDALAPTQSVDVEACWKQIISAARGRTPEGWFDR